MEMTTCPTCGKRNDPGDHVCIHCGTALDEAGAVLLRDAPEPPPGLVALAPPEPAGFPRPDVAVEETAAAPDGAAAAAALPRSNGPAVAALVCGIAGLVLVALPVVGLILAIAAMALGGIGFARSNAGAGGRGLAIAGLALGAVDVVLQLLIMAALVSFGERGVDLITPTPLT
jgi:hypothetical protein